jgi:hypothetical protein
MYQCTVVTKEGDIKQFSAENPTDAVSYADSHFPKFKQLVALSGATTIVKRGVPCDSSKQPSDCSTVPSSASRGQVPPKSSRNSLTVKRESDLWCFLSKLYRFIRFGA